MNPYPDAQPDPVDELARLLIGAPDEDETEQPITEHRFGHLTELHIATPCSVDWEAMVGDAKVRHCAVCKLDVYNLSAMTEEEAAGLLASHSELPCVRLYSRKDGTILFQDCPEGVSQKEKEQTIAVMGRPAPSWYPRRPRGWARYDLPIPPGS